MAPEIPGFYFDPEKKKYFKIQANHVAPPGSQYSSASVKRKRIEEEKHEKSVHLKQRESRETVRKAGLLHHPLVGADREIGSRLPASARHDQQARVYASHLQQKKLHQFQPWPNDYSIRHVMRNPRTGVLIASGHQGGHSSVSICLPDSEEEGWTYSHTMEQVLFKEAYRLSSMSLSRTGYLLATMDSGPDGDSFLAPRMLPDPYTNADRWPNSLGEYRIAHPTRIRTTSSLWCSAARPTGSKALFAIGTSDGLQILEGWGDLWTLSQKPFPDESNVGSQSFRRHGNSSSASVSAVEWLSADVIASGLRNSSVLLHDLRSGGSAVRLQHPHAVSKIRKADEYRIVVGGYNSLQMYDIRFAPNGIQHRPNPNASHHTSTRPYLTFPEYSPNIIPDFDVSTELSLVASASDDRKIQLFSLQTGTPVFSPLSQYRYSGDITSVCFEASESRLNRRGPQTPSLLVCANATVDQWVW